jgi:hypothetical protein
MKKAIIKTRTIISVLVTFLILGFSQAAQSAEKTLPGEKTASTLDFKFVGKLGSGPLFQLNMNNAEADEFVINVKDADGNLLYSEKLKGVNVSRKYQFAIDREELYDAFYIKFEITSVKTNKTFIYNATNKSSVVSDIIVAKL